MLQTPVWNWRARPFTRVVLTLSQPIAGASGRQIATVAGLLCGAIACGPANRVVAIQLDATQVDAGSGTGGADGAGGMGNTSGSMSANAGEAGQTNAAPTFSVPTLVEGLFSVPTNIHDPTLPSNELELLLSCDGGNGANIFSSTRASITSAWSPATLVQELSSTGNNTLDPEFSPDGLTVYLSSDRAGAGYRLYVSKRSARDQPWTTPVAMTGLTPESPDMGPTVSPDGLYMVFASQRGTTYVELYSASRTDPNGPWENVTPLASVNSKYQDENPALFNDSRSLVWSSRRTGGGSTSDLFQSDRSDASAMFSSTATSLDALNSRTDWDGDPWLSQDGHHILFVSERDNSVALIFEAWR